MVDVIIPELLDGETIRIRLAEGIFQQGNITYRGSIRPNPPRLINALNQSQLEAELGSDLEIPADTSITIMIDEDFTLTKPFKLGLQSTIDIIGSTIRTTLRYTGPGALIQNENPANPIRSVRVERISLRGDGDEGTPADGTNSVFDVRGISFLICTDVQVSDFGSIGITEFPVNRIVGFSPTNVSQGWVIKNPLLCIAEGNIATSFIETGFTFMSFIIETGPAEIIIDKTTPLNLFPLSALLYIPPNPPTGTQVTVNRSLGSLGDVFQQGSDIPIFFVQDNGAGKARFISAPTAQGLVVGKVVTLSGFVESTYNGTFIVTAVETPFTGVTFDVEAITFLGSTDIGNLNAASLDGSDIFVLTAANSGIPNSMFVGESGLEIFGSEVTSSSLAQNAFEVITSTSWTFNNLERFEEGLVNTGQMKCIDPGIKEYTVSYSATLEKDSGGALNIGIVILKNGVNVSFNAPHTVNTGKIQITGTDIIELTETDTLDIAVINYNGTATPIIISQASLVVSRA